MDGIMSYLELILQKPIENLPTLAFILVGFFQVAKMAMGLFSTSQTLQAGSQKIIMQDNDVQKLFVEEMTARRVSDEEHKRQLVNLMNEFLKRIDDTTLATHADVKVIAAQMARFDKGFGLVYQKLKAKGVI